MRRLREKAGKSLDDVGGKLKLSKVFLSHLERGMRNWDEGRMKAFKEALR